MPNPASQGFVKSAAGWEWQLSCCWTPWHHADGETETQPPSGQQGWNMSFLAWLTGAACFSWPGAGVEDQFPAWPHEHHSRWRGEVFPLVFDWNRVGIANRFALVWLPFCQPLVREKGPLEAFYLLCIFWLQSWRLLQDAGQRYTEGDEETEGLLSVLFLKCPGA